MLIRLRLALGHAVAVLLQGGHWFSRASILRDSSDISSVIMMPAMTVSLRSPISPKLAFEMADIAVETRGEIGQMVFLPGFACHAVGFFRRSSR